MPRGCAATALRLATLSGELATGADAELGVHPIPPRRRVAAAGWGPAEETPGSWQSGLRRRWPGLLRIYGLSVGVAGARCRPVRR
jgi:hypothetical protein